MKTLKYYFEAFMGHKSFLFIFNLVIALVIIIVANPYAPIVLTVSSIAYLLLGIIYARTKYNEQFLKALPGRIRYRKVIKEIKIQNENGDAEIGFTFEGENLRDTKLPKLFHELRKYTCDDRLEDLPTEINGIVDGQKKRIPVESFQRIGKNGQTSLCYDSKFTFRFDDPISAKSRFPTHSFKYQIRGLFKKGFMGKDDSVHAVEVQTDEIEIRIKINKPFVILPDSDSPYKVVDFHENEDGEELKRVQDQFHPVFKEREIVWKIRNPLLTYKYKLLFGFKRTSD